jgi:hypothetical protein
LFVGLARDLYPYQLKLASIDNMRKNGIFYDDEGNIPEGRKKITPPEAEF